MRRIIGGALSVGTLAMSPIIVSLATFLSVPIVLTQVGAEPWVSIAVGQAIGEIVRVITIWGWNSAGLARVAGLDTAGRLSVYFTSIAPRAILFLAAVLVATLFGAIVPTEDRLALLLMIFAGGIYGLTAGWVFVGGGQPQRLLIYDALPRAVFPLLSAVLLFIFPFAWIFSLGNLVGALIAVLLGLFVVTVDARRARIRPEFGSWRIVKSELIDGFPAFFAAVVLGLRMAAPVLIAPFAFPAGAPAAALSDKFFRWTNTGMTPIMQTVQVRIPRGGDSLKAKVRRAFRVTIPASLIMGLLVAAMTPLLSPIISGGEIAIGLSVSVALGLAVAGVFTHTILGNSLLVIMNRKDWLLKSSVIGLIVGGALMMPLIAMGGVTGAFWAFGLAEVSVAITLAFVILRLSKNSQLPRHRAEK